MKTSSLNSSLKIILIFISFVLTTFLLGGFLLNGLLRIPSQIANSLVIVAIVYITYRIYKKEGKDVSELGLDLRFKNLRFIPLGFMIGGLFIIPLVFIIAWIKGYPVIFNENFDPIYVLNGLWILAPTVLLEELAFRGICFKKTVAMTGVVKANILFASIFLLSHWINLGAFGNVANMTVLSVTVVGHLLYATALLTSKTIYFPMAIHLGNNWFTLFVFNGLDVNDPTAGQVKNPLINVVAESRILEFNGEFILTTITTIALFLLLTLAIKKWGSNKNQLQRCN